MNEQPITTQFNQIGRWHRELAQMASTYSTAPLPVGGWHIVFSVDAGEQIV